jgi:hypothetical protein
MATAEYKKDEIRINYLLEQIKELIGTGTHR